eukprot:TRINITY_DN7955_c0_g1_i2.p1 TRINITY_DN7955_c0_g1~~TRINITY_DN7955_c0_g1_i2.p1  ORF type:complete len:1083 (+),score=287.04 TRINITY_DN7955_c0_g1_i2:131-3250(+)
MAEQASPKSAPAPAPRPKPTPKPRKPSVASSDEGSTAPAPSPKPRPKPAVKPPKPSRPIPAKPQPSRQASMVDNNAAASEKPPAQPSAQAAASATAAEPIKEPEGDYGFGDENDNVDIEDPAAANNAETATPSEAESPAAAAESIAIEAEATQASKDKSSPAEATDGNPEPSAASAIPESASAIPESAPDTAQATPAAGDAPAIEPAHSQASSSAPAENVNDADNTRADADNTACPGANAGHIATDADNTAADADSVKADADNAELDGDAPAPPVPSRAGRAKLKNTKVVVKSRKASTRMPPRPAKPPPAKPGTASPLLSGKQSATLPPMSEEAEEDELQTDPTAAASQATTLPDQPGAKPKAAADGNNSDRGNTTNAQASDKPAQEAEEAPPPRPPRTVSKQASSTNLTNADNTDNTDDTPNDKPAPVPPRDAKPALDASPSASPSRPAAPLPADADNASDAGNKLSIGKAPLPLPTDTDNSIADNSTPAEAYGALPPKAADGNISSDDEFGNYEEAEKTGPMAAIKADHSHETYLSPQSGQEEVYADNKRNSMRKTQTAPTPGELVEEAIPPVPKRTSTPPSLPSPSSDGQSTPPVVPKPYLETVEDEAATPRGLPGAAEAIATAKGKAKVKRKKSRGLFGRRRASDRDNELDDEAMQLLSGYSASSPVVGKATAGQEVARDQPGMLNVRPRQTVDILCMDRPCPQGYWICRNSAQEIGFMLTKHLNLDPTSVSDLLAAVPKPKKRTTSEEGLPLDMKGSSLAVTIITEEEFDRQKRERDEKLKAQQPKNEPSSPTADAPKPAASEPKPAATDPTPAAIDPRPAAAAPSAEGETYEAVDDPEPSLYATADEVQPATVTVQPSEDLYASADGPPPTMNVNPGGSQGPDELYAEAEEAPPTANPGGPRLPPPRLEPKDTFYEGDTYAVPTNEEDGGGDVYEPPPEQTGGEVYAVPTNEEQGEVYEDLTNEPAVVVADDQEIYEDMADAHVPPQRRSDVYTEMELQPEPGKPKPKRYEEVTLRVEEDKPPVVPPRGESRA